MRSLCAQLTSYSHHLRNPPSSSSLALPHVSSKPFDFLIPQFPVNSQQCLEGLRKTHEERSSCTSPCRPAPGLHLSQRHSRHHSSTGPGAPSIAGRRRNPDKMSRSDCESLVFVIEHSWRGRQSGMPQRKNLSEINSFISHFPGFLSCEGDLCRSRSPSLSAYSS